MKDSRPFYIIIFGLFLIICAPTLWSKGMFMDGLYYATISRNLSEGIGSFWQLHFTATSYPIFYEHPPLAMGLQSIFFKIFGDSVYVERFYSLLTFIITGIIIHLIWQNISNKKIKNLSWIPLLFWIMIPLNSWACSNNMLENTMNIFVCLSILFALQSLNYKKLTNIFFAGLCLSLAFLSKGFVGLFPLSFFFWYFIVFKKINLNEMISRSIILFLFTILPFFLLYFFYPPAIDSLENYINKQVFGSIKNISTVENRFFILKKLFLELMPAIILCLIIIYYSIKRNFSINSQKKKWTLLFFLLGMSGIIPIMISMKQSGFYLLATLPLFSISFGILTSPLIASIIPKNNYSIYFISGLTIVGSILLSVKQINVIGRDQEIIKDINSILTIVPKNTIISTDKKMDKNYSLKAYFARYANISLTDKQNYFYHVSYNKESREIKKNANDCTSKITELYTIKYPITKGGMIWYSGEELLSLTINLRGLSLFESQFMYTDFLRDHIQKCKTTNNKPFGLNIPLIYPNIKEDIKIIIYKLADMNSKKIHLYQKNKFELIE